MLALFPKRSVSQEQVHSHKAGSFLCAETEMSEPLALPQGVRHPVGGEGTLPERKCCITQGNTRTTIPVLSSWKQHSAGWIGLKGGPQKCSALAKVCVSGLCFKHVILESQIRLTLCSIFKIQISYMHMLVTASRKKMLGRGGLEGVNSVEILNRNIGYGKDFLCMYIFCPWFAIGAAARCDSIRKCSQK